MYSKENKFRSTSDELAKHFPYDHVLAGAVRRRVGAKQAGEAARARADRMTATTARYACGTHVWRVSARAEAACLLTERWTEPTRRAPHAWNPRVRKRVKSISSLLY